MPGRNGYLRNGLEVLKPKTASISLFTWKFVEIWIKTIFIDIKVTLFVIINH